MLAALWNRLSLSPLKWPLNDSISVLRRAPFSENEIRARWVINTARSQR
jgi:hypothetical protein